LGIDSITGKRRQRSKSFKTKREAQAAMTTWLAEIDKGAAVDRSRQTVADLLRYWLDTYARPNVRPKTLQLYEDTIDRHLVPGLGHVPVQKLTAAAVQAFYAERLAAGVSAWAVAACHQRLKQALTMAVRLGIVAGNVCAMVRPPRVRHREMTTWDADQARRFLAVASTGSAYGPIWMVALATGMRRGELLGLRWQDVDLERGTVHVRQSVGRVRGKMVLSQPKSRAGKRVIPLQAAVVAALRDHKVRQNERRLVLGAAWEDHDLVFAAASGRPINPSNLRRDFMTLAKRAGVPVIRIHDQRHTYATLGLSTGASLKALSESMGHAQTSITINTYAHALPHQRREVADKVADVLFGETPRRESGPAASAHP
jgi:integrase